jgi:phosphatidylglycerophosphatase A
MTPGALSPWHPAALLATWFGSGRLPKAPGTWGTLAALPVAILIAELAGRHALILATLLVAAGGLWASHRYLAAGDRAASGDHDPGEVVIDEAAGLWLTLWVLPFAWPYYLYAFLAFRLFDIAKPWPIRLLERRLPGAWGVMADDLLAGLYAWVLYAVLSGLWSLLGKDFFAS